MKQSAKVNYFFNVSYQIFALIVPLVVTPYVSRVLGADGIGTYSYTYSIVNYFMLMAALGVATFAIREIGIWQDSKEKRSEIFWNVYSLRFILTSVMLVFYFLYVIFIAENKKIAAFQSIYLFTTMFEVSWFFQGMEDFKKISIRNIIMKLLSVVFIFIFVKDKNDLPLYIIGHGGFLLLGTFVIWIPIRKYINKPDFKKIRPFRNFPQILLLFLPTVANQIFFIVDKSMIGWMTKSMEQNGYYEQSLKIVEMILIVITALSYVMMPKISRAFKNGDKEVIQDSLNKSFQFAMMASLPMCFGLFIVSNTFVPWFFGKEFSPAIPVLEILGIMFIFSGINSVTGTQYFISTKQTNKHVYMMIAGGLVNIIANLILIPRMYAKGAAIGSVMGEVVISVLELSYMHFSKQYNVIYIIKNCYKYFISACVMLGAGLLINKYMNHSIPVMILSVIVCIIVYGICLLLLRDKFILEQGNSIIKKIKGKL